MSFSTNELRYLVSSLIKENRAFKKANQKLLRERGRQRRRIAELEQQRDSQRDIGDDDRAAIAAQEQSSGEHKEDEKAGGHSDVSMGSGPPPVDNRIEDTDAGGADTVGLGREDDVVGPAPKSADAPAAEPAVLSEDRGSAPSSPEPRAKPLIVGSSSDDDRSPPKKKLKPNQGGGRPWTRKQPRSGFSRQQFCPKQHIECKLLYCKDALFTTESCDICGVEIPPSTECYHCVRRYGPYGPKPGEPYAHHYCTGCYDRGPSGT